MAGASPVTASKPAPLPVLYKLGGGLGSVWDNPEVRPAIFYIFADGSGAVIGMHWARWNHGTAVTSRATDYSRTGPCCTKVRPALLQGHGHAVGCPVSRRPAPGAVLHQDGHHRPRLRHPQVHLQGLPARQPRDRPLDWRRLVRRLILAAALAASLLAGSAGTAAASAPRPPVVHDSLGWNQDLTRPSYLGALDSLVPPKAIDGDFVLEKLRWSSWGQRFRPRHRADRLGAARARG